MNVFETKQRALKTEMYLKGIFAGAVITLAFILYFQWVVGL